MTGNEKEEEEEEARWLVALIRCASRIEVGGGGGEVQSGLVLGGDEVQVDQGVTWCYFQA